MQILKLLLKWFFMLMKSLKKYKTELVILLSNKMNERCNKLVFIGMW